MAYDVTLVQVNANIGGFHAVNTDMGFGTAPFDFLLFDMWTCLPTLLTFHSNGGPVYVFFFEFSAGPTSTQIKIGRQDTGVYFFDGTFNVALANVRSNHLVSVNCQTQTVQYYVNDVAVSLSSGGWTGPSRMQVGASINIWDFDVGSSFGIVYPAFADLWCASTLAWVDLSVTANRRRFINSDLTPVDLGPTGSSPFGIQPQVYQTVPAAGVANDFLVNRGTGPDFVLGGGNTLSLQMAGVCTLPPVPPPVPTGLSCGAVSSPAAIAPTWSATDPAADTYTVQYRRTGTESWTTITGIAATTVTISGLAVAASYEWEVASVITGVTGLFSTIAVCATPGLSQPVPQSLNRWRGSVGINWHGLALVGDAFSNVIGLSDFNTFTEYGNTMQFLVTTPPLHDDRKRIFVSIFEIEVEAGQGLPTPPYGPPQMMLDVSKDGGVTWQQLQSFRSMGSVGQYFKRLRWINLGQSRTWVFRLRCTDPVRRYIIGTYIDQYKGLG